MENEITSASPRQGPSAPEGGRCTDVLSDTLTGYAGIHQAEFDVASGYFSLSYDPHVLSEENALRLVRTAGRQAYTRTLQCQHKSEGACRACTLQM
jgi:hypothetical protein